MIRRTTYKDVIRRKYLYQDGRAHRLWCQSTFLRLILVMLILWGKIAVVKQPSCKSKYPEDAYRLVWVILVSMLWRQRTMAIEHGKLHHTEHPRIQLFATGCFQEKLETWNKRKKFKIQISLCFWDRESASVIYTTVHCKQLKLWLDAWSAVWQLKSSVRWWLHNHKPSYISNVFSCYGI